IFMSLRPKVGINGFGRIGRVLFRAGWEKLDILAINDMTDLKTLAHLLAYDSIHGRFPGKVEVAENALVVNGKKIPVYTTKDPRGPPWKAAGVALVLKCPGPLKKKGAAMKHIARGGPKCFMFSAPADDSDLTIVMGVNQK